MALKMFPLTQGHSALSGEMPLLRYLSPMLKAWDLHRFRKGLLAPPTFFGQQAEYSTFWHVFFLKGNSCTFFSFFLVWHLPLKLNISECWRVLPLAIFCLLFPQEIHTISKTIRFFFEVPTCNPFHASPIQDNLGVIQHCFFFPNIVVTFNGRV